MVNRDERHTRNQAVIDQLRANGGKNETMTLLILTTTGAKSGKPFTTPLAYLRDGDRLLVFASKGGDPKHPDWYLNLVANPEVTVEADGETFKARATSLQGEERDRLYAKQVEASPVFGDYEKKTTRVIPVVALERI
jgi:deazaflavin-dependent oxidoreductase (nitroreductase family)